MSEHFRDDYNKKALYQSTDLLSYDSPLILMALSTQGHGHDTQPGQHYISLGPFSSQG